MVEFSQTFPQRFFDVAIAEQHAVTLAAGLACEGLKPVVAIYSTFLQRAYDQLVHDVALQNLDVTFAVDRAGLVGEDGPTHSGCFDIAFLRCIPNMVIAAPSDENECHQLLYTAYNHIGPAAVRYPRGTGVGQPIVQNCQHLALGFGRQILVGKKVAILNFGVLLPQAVEVAQKHGFTVYDMRWVKPLDTQAILHACHQTELLVTLEEGCVAGGAGSAVTEFLSQQGIVKPVLQLGIPDQFIDHASRAEQLEGIGLTAKGIESSIHARLKAISALNTHCANDLSVLG
jgi:1-deoxy-D-xylulose-5-phosphate synthase